MATMFFGQYLLAKGAIDRGALLDALDRQRRSNLSLTELAIQQGLIDRAMANSVMVRYRMSDAPIEVILKETGGLGPEDVQRLQSQQRSSWLQIGRLMRPEPPVWSNSAECVSPTESAVHAVAVSADLQCDVRVFSAAEGAS